MRTHLPAIQLLLPLLLILVLISLLLQRLPHRRSRLILLWPERVDDLLVRVAAEPLADVSQLLRCILQ